MRSISSETAGRFRCEVSAEAPSFQTVSGHADMTIVRKLNTKFIFGSVIVHRRRLAAGRISVAQSDGVPSVLDSSLFFPCRVFFFIHLLFLAHSVFFSSFIRPPLAVQLKRSIPRPHRHLITLFPVERFNPRLVYLLVPNHRTSAKRW